jgi:hypothetical protein
VTDTPPGVVAIYWKQLTTAERRQLGNASNAEETAGGGARDLRCRPSEDLQQAFQGTRTGRDSKSTVYRREVFFIDADGNEQAYTLDYSINDSDSARPNETRIRRAGYCPAWTEAAITDPPEPRDAAHPSPPENFGGDRVADYIVYVARLEDDRVFVGLIEGTRLGDQHPAIESAIRSARQGGRTFG